MKTIAGDGFEVQAPDAWGRVLSEGSEAFTLAQQPGGTGALQISVARDATDVRPLLGDLRDIIAAMAERNSLGAPVAVSYFELEPLRGAESAFHHGDDFVRVWSVSDGRSFALVTYVCRLGSEAAEAEACDAIVRSIAFARAG